MKLLSSILRTLFGVYALIIFACALTLSFICYLVIFSFVRKTRAPFIAHKYISRPWAKSILFFYGIRTKIINKQVLDKKQIYVFIGNHRSLLDIPAYAIATDHVIRFLAKAELTKIPLLGYVISKLYLSVDRKDKQARAKSMDNMMKSLQDGISVFICPEGTRNKSSMPLLPFHDGAFRLAIQTQLPLAILVVKNSEKLLSPKNPIALRPGVIECYWCEPLQTKGMKQEDVPVLKQMAREVMEKVLVARHEDKGIMNNE